MKYFARTRISVFNELKSNFQVKFKPNANNQTFIPVELDYEEKTDANSVEMVEPGCTKFISCFGRRTHMDKKFKKSAFCVLEKIKLEKHEEREKDLLKDRISKIETSLENNTRVLNKINNKLNAFLH